MTVTEKEMNLALEILRNNPRPTLNHVLEMVLRYNSREEKIIRLDFMKMNLLVTRMAHSFIPGKIVAMKTPAVINNQVESLLAVA